MAGFTARRFSAYSARAVLGRISISAFSIINSGGQAESTLAHAVSYDSSVIPLTARILFMSSVKHNHSELVILARDVCYTKFGIPLLRLVSSNYASIHKLERGQMWDQWKGLLFSCLSNLHHELFRISQ